MELVGKAFWGSERGLPALRPRKACRALWACRFLNRETVNISLLNDSFFYLIKNKIFPTEGFLFLSM